MYRHIRSHSTFLTAGITKLEVSRILLHDLAATVENVQEQLKTTPQKKKVKK